MRMAGRNKSALRRMDVVAVDRIAVADEEFAIRDDGMGPARGLPLVRNREGADLAVLVRRRGDKSDGPAGILDIEFVVGRGDGRGIAAAALVFPEHLAGLQI